MQFPCHQPPAKPADAESLQAQDRKTTSSAAEASSLQPDIYAHPATYSQFSLKHNRFANLPIYSAHVTSQIQRLLTTDNETDSYAPALDQLLQALTLSQLYAFIPHIELPLLHLVASVPRNLHTRGVATYIRYLSENSDAYHEERVNILFEGLFPQQYCPQDITSLIVTYLPNQLDESTARGERNAIDYAYEGANYVYPLLRQYGSRHTNKILASRIRAHIQSYKIPYQSHGESLLQAATVQGDVELVWLLLGQVRKPKASRYNYWHEAERIVNARFNQDPHLPLKPGYNLVGYCPACQRIGIDCREFMHKRLHQSTTEHHSFKSHNVVKADIRTSICPVCRRKMKKIKSPYFILYQCRYALYVRYRFCKPNKSTCTRTGQVGHVPLRIDHDYQQSKGTFFRVSVAPLLPKSTVA